MAEAGASGDPKARSVRIVLLNEAGRDKFSWILRDAWRTRLLLALLSEVDDVLYKTVKLACESVELQDP